MVQLLFVSNDGERLVSPIAVALRQKYTSDFGAGERERGLYLRCPFHGKLNEGGADTPGLPLLSGSILD